MAFFATVVVPLVFMFGFLYLIVIRPQKKQQDARVQMQNALKVGDKVETTAGLLGTVESITEDSFVLVTADSKLELRKYAAVRVTPADVEAEVM